MRGSHPREFWARPSSCPLTPWGVIGGSLRASGQLYLASFCPPWSCLPQSFYLPLRSDDPVSFASESAKRHPDHKWHDKVLDPFYWNLPKLCSESPEPSTAPLDVFFRPICMRFLPAFFFFPLLGMSSHGSLDSTEHSEKLSEHRNSVLFSLCSHHTNPQLLLTLPLGRMESLESRPWVVPTSPGNIPLSHYPDFTSQLIKSFHSYPCNGYSRYPHRKVEELRLSTGTHGEAEAPGSSH